MLEPLASRLTNDEADDALHFGLSLLESDLNPDDGDGPWNVGMKPLDSCEAALAAIDAGADVSLEVSVVRFVNSGLDRSSDEAKVARGTLKNKIRKLEIFADLAASHAAGLRAKFDLRTDEADDTEPSDE